MTPLATRVRRSVGSAIRGVANSGNAVECPCCGSTFKRFMPFGRVPRPNARCATCGAVERHRLLWLYLQRETEIFHEPTRLLHVAPEPQFEKHFRAAPNIDYVTCDIEPGRADMVVDLRAMAFPDESFDVIICNHVLEHIVEDREAMRELQRVLTPFGWAILMVPLDYKRGVTLEDESITDPQERLRVFGQEDHVRIYGRDYVERLHRSGFDVVEIDYALTLSQELVRRYAVMNRDMIHHCFKSAPRR